MKNDEIVGILIIIGLITIGLTGGLKGTVNNGLISGDATPVQKQADIQQQINQTQVKVDELKKQVESVNDSRYKGLVKLGYVNRGYDASQEFITIQENSFATTSILVTGWKLKSLRSGYSITIPKGTYLYFINTVNVEDNIYLNPNDTLYLISGVSPNGANFKTNKCIGYLAQSQTYVPYLGSSCPAARDEDLSSIPKTTINDACLDYIEYFPQCKTQTESLPVNWSYECTKFIYDKLNYPSCVNTHRNDKDFYKNELRVYLKNTSRIWKDSHEEIVLYDDLGKIVDSIKY
jgi:hypothetical protein